MRVAQNIPTVLGSPVTKELPSAKLSEAEEQDRLLLVSLQQLVDQVNGVYARLRARNITVVMNIDRTSKEGKALVLASATKHIYWNEKELQGAANAKT